MSEVSCRALVLYFNALERVGIPASRLVEVVPWSESDLRNVGLRIPWDDFAVLTDHLGELIGGDEALVWMGRRFLEERAYRRMGRLMRLAVGPAQLYGLNMRMMGGWMFHAPEYELRDLGGGALELTVRLPPPYRPSLAFYRVFEGALAAWPLQVDMPHTEVTLDQRSPREAVYEIRMTRSWSLLGEAVRQRAALLRGVFRPDSLIESLVEREDETRVLVRTLNRERRALQQSRDDLEQKRKQLEVVTEERLELERQLLHAQKLESLGLIASGIAHDFNNLLTGIQANVEMLLTEEGNSEDARRRLRRIARAASRASDLTNRILAYSGRAPSVVHPFDLSGLVEDLGDLLEAALPKTVRIQTDLAKDLPSVEGDPAQVQQVVMNLITNAAEAMEGAEGVVRLHTRAEDLRDVDAVANVLAEPIRPGRYVVLEVRDGGDGLDPELRGRIFDPFFSTKGHGRGLGLSTVIGVVRGHGGALEVETPSTGGTVFRAWFPACDATHAPALESSVVESSEPGGTVLVVDDEEIVRQTAADLLEAHGFNTLVAADGQEGLSVVASDPSGVDVVLLDWSMPGLAGSEVFEAMRRRWPEIPVVLCSAYDLRDELDGLWAQGLAAFVRKPWTGRELSRVLRTHQRR